jgi:hypothetical protein
VLVSCHPVYLAVLCLHSGNNLSLAVALVVNSKPYGLLKAEFAEYSSYFSEPAHFYPDHASAMFLRNVDNYLQD